MPLVSSKHTMRVSDDINQGNQEQETESVSGAIS